MNSWAIGITVRLRVTALFLGPWQNDTPQHDSALLVFLTTTRLTKRRVTKTKQQAGGPPKKNAVILSPFYSRVTGTKCQAGRLAGIKREKYLAEPLRYANDQVKRGMPRLAV